jgi:hypothetical protein
MGQLQAGPYPVPMSAPKRHRLQLERLTMSITQFTELSTSSPEVYHRAPCPSCGSFGPSTISPDAGPWPAQLRCRCGYRLRGLSKYQAKQVRLAQQAPPPLWPDTTLGRAFRAAMHQAQGVVV